MPQNVLLFTPLLSYDGYLNISKKKTKQNVDSKQGLLYFLGFGTHYNDAFFYKIMIGFTKPIIFCSATLNPLMPYDITKQQRRNLQIFC